MEKTLARLLKDKNILATKINEIKSRIQTENVTVDNNKSKYDLKTEYLNFILLTEELIDVKTKISRLNVQVVDKIYKLSELKARVAFLRGLDTKEGVFKDKWNRDNSTTEKFTPQLDRIFVDNEIQKLMAQIDILQDELDTYNHSTKI